MCDLSEPDEISGADGVSRRCFGFLSMAALAACVSSPADAQAVTEQDVMVPTEDGEADAFFVHPAQGRHPGVLIWPDIASLRPAYRLMARRLAESGYAVLVVNPYYRTQRAPVLAEGETLGDGAVFARLRAMRSSITNDMVVADGRALVRFLDAQRSVDTARKIGVSGYCGGAVPMLRTAAAVPERVGAGASFHGGGLVTDAPTSPHLLIPQTRASFLIAIAQNDDAQQPNAKTVLRETCDAAGHPAEIEVYPAQHGWCALDSAAYDQVQADRAWARMLALFETALA